MNSSLKQLNNHNLRSTPMRLAVLELFNKHKVALSKQDLEKELKDHDRITLYRTLKSFEDKGLIHKVFDTSQITKYAICSDNCNDVSHEDGHIHFLCVQCNQTTCLDEIPMPQIKLPDSYTSHNMAMTVEGVCGSCN